MSDSKNPNSSDYRNGRFDFHMELEDIGFHATRELALAALRAELAGDDDCSTQPIDSSALRDALDDAED